MLRHRSDAKLPRHHPPSTNHFRDHFPEPTASKSSDSRSWDRVGGQQEQDGHFVWRSGDLLAARYRLQVLIGTGSFGCVFKAEDTRSSRRRTVAVKVFRAGHHFSKSARVERDVLQRLDGRHSCVPLLDHFRVYRRQHQQQQQQQHQQEEQQQYHMCLVLPLLGLSVYDFMTDNDCDPATYSLDQVRIIGAQLCLALCHLHCHGYAHTDVKPENVLLTDSSCDVVYDAERRRDKRHLRCCNIRLIDFGSAVRCDNSGAHSGTVTTRYYRAPEVALRWGWSLPCDVWSAGCVLVELYTGSVLFPAADSRQLPDVIESVLGCSLSHRRTNQRANTHHHSADRSLSPPHNSRLSHTRQNSSKLRHFLSRARAPGDNQITQQQQERHGHFVDLIEQMLTCEPSQRITMPNVVNHPFFA